MARVRVPQRLFVVAVLLAACVLSAAMTAPCLAGGTTVSVSATTPWSVDTGVSLTVGQEFKVMAKGMWTSGAWTGGPNGQPSQPPTSGAFLLPHSIPYALIGKIGDGPAFFIGEHYAGSPSGQGALMLSMNDAPPYADIDPYGDNEGSLTVRVTAAPNPPLTFQVPAMSPWSRDTGVYLSTSTGSTSPVFGQIANRHRSGSNICFADGHVKWLATADAPKHDSRFENVTFDAPAASDAASATVEMDGRKWLVLCDSKAGDFADWRTSEPSRFYFDRAVGAYHYLIADGAEDYAFVPVAYHGRSFRLEFDVLPIRTDPRANFRLGVWDLKMRQVTPSCLYTDYFLDDNGYHVYLNGYWPGGSADTRPCAYADGQWYHTIVEYSATGREAVVTVRGTRDRQTFSATVTGIGDLSACNRIAMTSIGDGVCRGRIAVGYVKNVKLLEELGKTRD